MRTFNDPLIRVLYEAMEGSGLTREEIAHRSGVCVSTLKGWVREDNSPTLNLYKAVAEVVGLCLETRYVGIHSRRTMR